jgi:hypothetical protein
MGLALGIFVGFLPIMGIQMAVVLPFALLFRGNKAAAIAGVWITNPVTVVPIYYANYTVGSLFTQHRPLAEGYFVQLFRNMSAAKFLQLGSDIVIPLVAGGFALGVVLGIPTYFVSRALISRYRVQKQKLKEALAAKVDALAAEPENRSVKVLPAGLGPLTSRDMQTSSSSARPRSTTNTAVAMQARAERPPTD